MSPNPPKMELKGVSKTFHARGGQTRALEPCDLSIAKGEFVTVVGPSGCGKSTVLRLAAGLETLQSGRVSIRGEAVGDPGARVHVPPERRHVGLLFWTSHWYRT